jgi:HEAT repeat protein
LDFSQSNPVETAILSSEDSHSKPNGIAGSLIDLFEGRIVPGEGGAVPLSPAGLLGVKMERAVGLFLESDHQELGERANEVRRLAAELHQERSLAPVAEAAVRLGASLASEAASDEAVDLARELVEPDVAKEIAVVLGAVREDERRRRMVDGVSKLGAGVATAIAEALSETEDRYARRAYIDAMVALGDSGMEIVAEMVEDSRWFVVRNAVGILGEIGGEQAVSHLTTTLASEDARVRKETVLTLARIGGDDASMLVVGKLEDQDADVRAAACRAIGVLKVARALKPLLLLLRTEKDDEVVEQVLLALGQLGDPGSVKAIEKRATGGLLSRAPTQVRIAAFKALFTIGTPHAKAVLEKATDDSDPEVKEAVGRILGLR